ncbi:hypothetical protein [Blautia difficilis]|uniref:Pilus assembly protein PilO n=1 Tax=Blautia difficilis TaxID=2763027 RepID=A0ABR7IFN3_9FIRM|nr:hypothetical protein [Blautia difficilis]MBC5778791.1 hypothetical protein [Blautia difficilis]
MNLSMREKKILLMFLGVLLFVCGFWFGYKPQMEEAENIQMSNSSLQSRLNDLLSLAENRDKYISETQSIEEELNKYSSNFPADVKAEDGIVLAQNMENTLDMEISNVGLGEKSFVASLDGGTEGDLVNVADETLSEQANAQTQSQIDDIEGTNTQEEQELQNASDAEVANQNAISQNPVLYRTQNSMQFTGTYASLKDAVSYLADQTGRMTLDNVSASFDSTTGNLTGTIVVNMFSMTGTGNTYSEPDAGSVSYGTDNIFGTIEQSKKSKKKNTNKAKKAQTQETDSQTTDQASQETGSENPTDNSVQKQ